MARYVCGANCARLPFKFAHGLAVRAPHLFAMLIFVFVLVCGRVAQLGQLLRTGQVTRELLHTPYVLKQSGRSHSLPKVAVMRSELLFLECMCSSTSTHRGVAERLRAAHASGHLDHCGSYHIGASLQAGFVHIQGARAFGDGGAAIVDLRLILRMLGVHVIGDLPLQLLQNPHQRRLLHRQWTRRGIGAAGVAPWARDRRDRVCSEAPHLGEHGQRVHGQAAPARRSLLRRQPALSDEPGRPLQERRVMRASTRGRAVPELASGGCGAICNDCDGHRDGQRHREAND
mmetsp:Transcript_17584/g.44552  ORF Transcript_17584/g.44552 Transcript_17584/m.44552 type:complete len:288 (+) Transcript_17584:652-1515(+)